MLGDSGHAGDSASAVQDGTTLGLMTKPYERKLIAAWAGDRFIKPTDEELDRALCRFREVSKRIEDLLSIKGTSLEAENERKSRR